MDDGEENGIIRQGFAVWIGAIAENQAEGICRLMPTASSLRLIRFCGVEAVQARNLKRISEVGGRQTVSQKLCESASAGSAAWVGEVVVDVRLTGGGKEEQPVLFDGRTGVGGITGQFCKGRVGF